jgi:DNA polymerase-3 subunit gamma/tau
LGRIQLSQITRKLEEISVDLGRTVEPEALHLIASFSEGSLRDAESLLDQILCFAEKTVSAEVVRTALGLISQDHFFALDKAFSEARAPFAFELVETLFQSGKDLPHFYEQLIEHVRNLSLARLIGDSALPFPPELSTRYAQTARSYAPSQCLYLLEYLLRSESQLQKSACQRVSLEAILLHYIQSKNRIPVEILVRRLAEMEEALKTHPEKPAPVIQAPPPPEKKEPIPAPIIQAQPPKPEAPLELKAAPFNPFKAEEPPPSPISEILPAKKEQPPVPKGSQARYDTLIRFAAVELEGKIN